MDVRSEMFTLEVKDKFNFDYAHFLGDYDGKCYRIHGHSAKVNVYVSGYKGDKFVMDFGVLKSIVKEVVDVFDHKLIVSSRYVCGLCPEYVEIRYDDNYMKLSRDMVVIIDGEVTIENITEKILDMICSKVKELGYYNVKYISVEISEGMHNYCKLTKKVIW